MKMNLHFLGTVVALALLSSTASASDPAPLQDFCVAFNDTNDAVFVNGKFCKNPKFSVANDFSFSGLQVPRNTSNAVGSTVSMVNADNLPGLNTLGVSIARIDFAPNGGVNPPHFHPRATELLLVLEGTLLVGFVTSNPDNCLFSKVLHAGDGFVFPMGTIHFQLNLARTSAVALANFGSQNAGLVTIANAVFGSNPPIDTFVLSKAFQLEKKVVEYLQAQF
ncbi:germin-like protein subfamily 1 member 7 [Malania oleifera]|uniref:germin-like protein subfamily 1 member 7 n=1 Tax=Malania oleifera TaxID=397392 RepID=UPI0025AEAA9E|nr:germin-like protein subfamily 1 member 7 [Malania oleifera]